MRRQPGERHGTVVLVERVPNKGWLVECDCGTRKVMQIGGLTSGEQKTCATRGKHGWSVGVTYYAAHRNLSRVRGRAKDQTCARCPAPAASWSYDGLDPNELTGKSGRNPAAKYSTDPNHYLPMCHPCHVSFDRNQK